MGRSRSSSPVGVRHRDRGDRDRERDRDRDRRRRRSRDRTDTSSRRRRSGERERPRRSFSRSPQPKEKEREPKPGPVAERPVLTEEELKDKSPAEQEMMKLMGFCAFDTTKGKKVTGNEAGTVHVILKRKYRQYMNRKGGFNRPLDFVA